MWFTVGDTDICAPLDERVSSFFTFLASINQFSYERKTIFHFAFLYDTSHFRQQILGLTCKKMLVMHLNFHRIHEQDQEFFNILDYSICVALSPKKPVGLFFLLLPFSPNVRVSYYIYHHVAWAICCCWTMRSPPPLPPSAHIRCRGSGLELRRRRRPRH